MWSGGLVAVLAELGFSDGAARIALTRLVRRDLLARHRDGRHIHYSLTRRTVALLADGDRRIFSLGRRERPAGEWTVLWQSIPESRRQARERLVRRLRFLGFGPYQDGTWIAPHDREAEVVALLAELDVTEHAGLLLGRPSTALDPELPAELVPPPDRRAAAVDLFHDLYTALAPAAQRHFDEVTR